ncbi:MAG: NAD(P)/FAD-dependent oxidoreductase [Rubritalea sp.]|mgnify:CR=1 FL=1|jgi:phytoene dehydrogenase-like protein
MSSNTQEVIIIGAGLSGLACALELIKEGVGVQVLEQDDAPGGRVRTDKVEGFLLDRGFQVYLDAYPNAGQLLDLAALDLQSFEPGAIIFEKGKKYRLMDVFRRPRSLFSSALSPIGNLMDKILVAKLRFSLKFSSIDKIQKREDLATEVYLKKFGFSDGMIDRFFRSFYGGIFLENELRTSSRMFEFTFKMFTEGSASLPARGMEEIPRQLSGRLAAGVLHCNTQVSEVIGGEVILASGVRLTFDHLVLAVPSDAAQKLLPALALPVVKWRSVTNCYFSAAHSPLNEAIIALSGDPNSLINNVSVPSDLSRDYAPEGQSLVSVSILGLHDEDDFLARVLSELRSWFGQEVTTWSHLRTDRIGRALPEQTPSTEQPANALEGVFLCGDQHSTTSIEGAITSGQETARRILAQRT